MKQTQHINRYQNQTNIKYFSDKQQRNCKIYYHLATLLFVDLNKPLARIKGIDLLKLLFIRLSSKHDEEELKEGTMTKKNRCVS